MTDLTLDQARGEVAALNDRIDAAKAAGTFDQNKAALEQDLRGCCHINWAAVACLTDWA